MTAAWEIGWQPSQGFTRCESCRRVRRTTTVEVEGEPFIVCNTCKPEETPS